MGSVNVLHYTFRVTPSVTLSVILQCARHRVLAIIQPLLLFVPSGAVLARRFKGNHMAAVALPLGREFDFDASAALSRSDWFGGSLSAVRSNQELVGRHELACCGYPGWKLVVRV